MVLDPLQQLELPSQSCTSPSAIRWAPAVPTIRQTFRCSAYGDKTSTLTAPSVTARNGWVQEFPMDHALKA
jgi:hypothetical protein